MFSLRPVVLMSVSMSVPTSTFFRFVRTLNRLRWNWRNVITTTDRWTDYILDEILSVEGTENRMTSLQTMWNFLTVSWHFPDGSRHSSTALTRHVRCYSYHARTSTKYLYRRKYAAYNKQFRQRFPDKFIPDIFLIFSKNPWHFSNSCQIPWHFQVSRQVVAPRKFESTSNRCCHIANAEASYDQARSLALQK